MVDQPSTIVMIVMKAVTWMIATIVVSYFELVAWVKSAILAYYFGSYFVHALTAFDVAVTDLVDLEN